MSKKSTAKKPSSKDEEVAGVGHNRPGGVACDKLKALVEKYENLEEEKSAIASDQRDVMAEVKGNGFDTKIFRAMVKLRKLDASERDEYFSVLDTYARALGFSILDLEPGPALGTDSEEE